MKGVREEGGEQGRNSQNGGRGAGKEQPGSPRKGKCVEKIQWPSGKRAKDEETETPTGRPRADSVFSYDVYCCSPK